MFAKITSKDMSLMRGNFILSQGGIEKAGLAGTAHPPRVRDQFAQQEWSLSLEDARPGLVMGDTKYEVTFPNGKVGQCNATQLSGTTLHLDGSGPYPG